MGDARFRSASLSQRVKDINIKQLMPVWPREGSVQFVGNIIVIKLDDYTSHQKAELCGFQVSLDFCD